MTRSRQFDYENLLDRAARLFWRKGYADSSVQELVDATGVNRASLYATFGDKHGLFLATLDYYRDRLTAERFKILNNPAKGLGAIEAYSDALLEASTGKDRSLGCLLINSAVERAAIDPTVAAFSSANLLRLERAFYDALRRAESAGEITSGRNLLTLARFLTSSLSGLRVTAKINPDKDLLHDIKSVMLQAVR